MAEASGLVQPNGSLGPIVEVGPMTESCTSAGPPVTYTAIVILVLPDMVTVSGSPGSRLPVSPTTAVHTHIRPMELVGSAISIIVQSAGPLESSVAPWTDATTTSRSPGDALAGMLQLIALENVVFVSTAPKPGSAMSHS